MNFLVDENVDAPIADRLRQNGHDVTCVWELGPGISDAMVLARADKDNAVLVTADKDFGELIFRLGQAHRGVLLIRLAGLSPDRKADVVSGAVREHGAAMAGAFTVATPTLVRVRRRSLPNEGHDM